MNRYIGFMMIFALIFAFGCDTAKDPQVIGGDKDDHGCLIAAGYQWCPSEQKCVRAWEEYCEELKEQFKIDSFESCIAAGNPVMESYPRQCNDGTTTFTEEINQPLEENLNPGDAHYCTEEEKAAQICTMDYTPVCGDDDITYGNGCGACASGKVDSYIMGECSSDGSDSSEGPKECGICPQFVSPGPEFCKEGRILSGQVDDCGCNMPPQCITSSLTEEEALIIAQESECVEEGQLTDRVSYNENTLTWWIDLDAEKPGCSPACVVSEATGMAEINWRCTGLIAPADDTVDSADIGDAEPGCSCPEGYIPDGESCNPECYYSEPACMIPSVACE